LAPIGSSKHLKKNKQGEYGVVQISEHELDEVGNKANRDFTAAGGGGGGIKGSKSRDRDDNVLEELNDGT
jgi:hypothetical protein